MAFCPKCGKRLREGYEFCDVCGVKIEESLERVASEKRTVPPQSIGSNKKRMLIRLAIPFLICLLIGATIIFAIPFPYKATEAYDVQEPYEAQETYETQETYEAQEPYEDVEYFTETATVPKQKELPLAYKLGDSDTWNCGALLDYWECISYPINNTDTEGGTFTLNCKAKIASSSDPLHVGKEFTDTASAYILPSEVKYLECGPFDIDVGDTMSYEGTTISGTKTVIASETENIQKSRTITKYRSVTKSRPVTKSRTVTKYRTVQKERQVQKKDTLFHRWIGKTKYWYKV